MAERNRYRLHETIIISECKWVLHIQTGTNLLAAQQSGIVRSNNFEASPKYHQALVDLSSFFQTVAMGLSVPRSLTSSQVNNAQTRHVYCCAWRGSICTTWEAKYLNREDAMGSGRRLVLSSGGMMSRKKTFLKNGRRVLQVTFSQYWFSVW